MKMAPNILNSQSGMSAIDTLRQSTDAMQSGSYSHRKVMIGPSTGIKWTLSGNSWTEDRLFVDPVEVCVGPSAGNTRTQRLYTSYRYLISFNNYRHHGNIVLL
jgi:hypothetical protein